MMMNFKMSWMFGAIVIALIAMLIWLKLENRELAKQFANESAIEFANESESIESLQSSSAISDSSSVTIFERKKRAMEKRLEWARQHRIIKAQPRVSVEDQLLHRIELQELLGGESSEIALKHLSDTLADYRQLNSRDRAIHDLSRMLENRGEARWDKFAKAMKSALTEAEYAEWQSVTPVSDLLNEQERQAHQALLSSTIPLGIGISDPYEFFPFDEPDQLDKLRTDWRMAAEFLRDERGNSQAILNGESGNAFGENADWHAERLAWLDETAGKIGIDLDSGNEVWLDELMADLTKAARESERVEMNRMGIPSHSQVERIHEAMMSQDEAEVKRVLENVGQIITIEQLSNPAPPDEE